MTDYLKLLLIRHAESLGNIEGRMEGQLSSSLSAHGRLQTQQLAAYLQQQLQPNHLYSSPLQRAVETAQPLQQSTGCALQLDLDLQELHQGVFQGLTWAEASQRYPALCTRLVASLDYHPVPGAETLTMAHQRAVAWYRALWQRHHAGDIIWLVSHAGLMQQLIGVIMGCDRTWQLPIRHTALFEFWLLSPDVTQPNQHNPECWKIVKFNETPHLSRNS